MCEKNVVEQHRGTLNGTVCGFQHFLVALKGGFWV